MPRKTAANSDPTPKTPAPADVAARAIARATGRGRSAVAADIASVEAADVASTKPHPEGCGRRSKVADGRLTADEQDAVRIIRVHPGRTGYELDSIDCVNRGVTDNRRRIGKRLGGLANRGKLVRGPRRTCTISGSRCVTWLLPNDPPDRRYAPPRFGPHAAAATAEHRSIVGHDRDTEPKSPPPAPESSMPPKADDTYSDVMPDQSTGDPRPRDDTGRPLRHGGVYRIEGRRVRCDEEPDGDLFIVGCDATGQTEPDARPQRVDELPPGVTPIRLSPDD